MKRYFVTAIFCVPLFLGAFSAINAAYASDSAQGDEHKGQSAGDIAAFILHHVSDDHVWEFESPLPGTHGPVFDMGYWFHGMMREDFEGACSQQVPAEWAAFPGLYLWNHGCKDFRPTKVTLMMWLASILLILTMWLGVNRDPQKLVPQGAAQNIIEVMVLFVRDEIAVKNIGKEEGARYTPFLCTIFFFILYMNWLGLIPNFGSATGALSVTLALATLTFLLTQYASIKSAGLWGFITHLTGGTPWPLWPIMIPVEILGLFTKPFALTIRLFANMLAGHLVLFFILALIFLISPFVAPVSVAMGVALYFLEIFVGLLQAFIFTMLSALFIGLGVQMGHHGHEEHGHAESHAH